MTSGLDTDSASSRTLFSMRSPWNVNATCAPPSASRRAIAHAIDRLLATPRTSARFPENIPGDAIRLRILCGALRRPLLLTVAIALVAATSASAAPTPLHREVREQGFQRVRAGHLTIPPKSPRGTTRVIVRLSAPPLAAWNAARPARVGSRTTQHLNVHSTASQAYVAQLARQQDAAVAAVRAAIPKRASSRSATRSSSTGSRSASRRRACRSCSASRASRRSIPSLSYYATMDRGPSVIHATDLAGGDRRQGPGREDRRRRHRRRPDEPVPQSRRLQLPGRLPEGRHEEDDAEGDRRQGLPRRAARREQHEAVRPDRAARHARVGDRGRRRRHERAGRARPSRRREPLRRRTEGVDRQLPRLHRPDPARPRGVDARDRARVRGGGRRRHERHQLLRRRPADRPGRTTRCSRRSTTSRSQASCR